MPRLYESRSLRLLFFTALCFAQGVPWGFIAVGYVVLSADLGFDNSAVGAALGLAYLLWPIIFAELTMGITLLAMMPFDPDVGQQVAGRRARGRRRHGARQAPGLVDPVRGDGAVHAGDHAVPAVHTGAPPGRRRWPHQCAPVEAHLALVDRAGSSQTRRAFSFSAPWWGVAAAALTPAGNALVSSPMSRMSRADLRLSEERIAFLSGAVDPVSGVVGALVGDVLADRFGARRTVGALMGGIAMCLAVFGARHHRAGVAPLRASRAN